MIPMKFTTAVTTILFLFSCDSSPPAKPAGHKAPIVQGSFAGMLPPVLNPADLSAYLITDTIHLRLQLDSIDSSFSYLCASGSGDLRFHSSGRWSVTGYSTLKLSPDRCSTGTQPIADSLTGLCSAPLDFLIQGSDTLIVTLRAMQPVIRMLDMDISPLLGNPDIAPMILAARLYLIRIE